MSIKSKAFAAEAMLALAGGLGTACTLIAATARSVAAASTAAGTGRRAGLLSPSSRRSVPPSMSTAHYVSQFRPSEWVRLEASGAPLSPASGRRTSRPDARPSPTDARTGTGYRMVQLG
jgi:hypothetical protein